MAFVNPEILQKIFGGAQQLGQTLGSAPQSQQQQLHQALMGAGAGMSQAAAQPGASFGQALGGGASGMMQGQQQAQQMQLNQMKMQQAQQEMERQERISKIMGDILQPRTPDFASQVATGPVQQPQIGSAQTSPYQGPGAMTARYESGGGGVGTVSTGQGDPGGVSYGTNQMSSDAGTMTAFLQSPEGQPFAQHFSGQEPGSPQFNQSYQEVAQGAGPEFERAQQQYLQRTHVAPVMQTAQQAGMPVDNPAIQAALHSQATQHSGAGNTQIINETMARIGPDSSAEDILDTLYDVRERYAVGALQQSGASEDVIEGVRNRYQGERQDTLAMLGERQVGPSVIQGQQTAQPQQAPLNGYQQRALEQQAGNPFANLPPQTRQVIAMLAETDPAAAMKMLADTQAPADLPAEVDALRWLTQGDDAKARELYAAQLQREAAGDPDQRARKVSDYQRLYGFSEAQSTKIADGLADFELNQNTGKVIYTDFTTGEVTEITPTRPGRDEEPDVTGPTLWEVAEKGNPTGLGSGLAEIGNRAGGQVGLEAFSDTVAQRRYFSNATQDFIRALALNERFPVQEMERIRREVNLEPSVFADEDTFKASMRSLDTTLVDRINYYKWVADDPSAPQDLRESMSSAARQMEWFRKRLGVPQGGGPAASPAPTAGQQGDSATPAPSGWEDDWQYLTPEERDEVLRGLD